MATNLTVLPKNLKVKLDKATLETLNSTGKYFLVGEGQSVGKRKLSTFVRDWRNASTDPNNSVNRIVIFPRYRLAGSPDSLLTVLNVADPAGFPNANAGGNFDQLRKEEINAAEYLTDARQNAYVQAEIARAKSTTSAVVSVPIANFLWLADNLTTKHASGVQVEIRAGEGKTLKASAGKRGGTLRERVISVRTNNAQPNAVKKAVDVSSYDPKTGQGAVIKAIPTNPDRASRFGGELGLGLMSNNYANLVTAINQVYTPAELAAIPNLQAGLDAVNRRFAAKASLGALAPLAGGLTLAVAAPLPGANLAAPITLATRVTTPVIGVPLATVGGAGLQQMPAFTGFTQ